MPNEINDIIEELERVPCRLFIHLRYDKLIDKLRKARAKVRK